MSDMVEILLNSGCLQINIQEPYTYASGIKGPVYCDNRLLMASAQKRKVVAREFQSALNEKKLKPDIIAGVATAGIVHATLLSDLLELPMIYVRPTPKSHGRKNLIEGRYEKGQKVFLVEDLINQGGSVYKAAVNLKEAGLDVIALGCIVSYEFEQAQELLKSLQIPVISLVSFDDILRQGQNHGLFNEKDALELQNWHSSPKNWARR